MSRGFMTMLTATESRKAWSRDTWFLRRHFIFAKELGLRYLSFLLRSSV